LIEQPKVGMKVVARSGVVRGKPGKDVYGLMFDAQS